MTAAPLPMRATMPLLLLMAAVVLAVAAVVGFGPEVARFGQASGLTTAEIGEVGVAPPPGARIPPDLAFTDLDGRRTTLGAALGGKPTLLIFADYGCTNLCGPALTLTRAGLEHSGLVPGRDYRVAVVGLNPATPTATARGFIDGQLGRGPLRAVTTALAADPTSTPALGRALGYRYRYDPAHAAFAHPVAAFVLAPDGRLSRALSEIGLGGDDLRLALSDAGQGRVGGLADPIRAHCYGFDPIVGAYDQGAMAMVKLVSLGLAAAGLVGLAMFVRRRSA